MSHAKKHSLTYRMIRNLCIAVLLAASGSAYAQQYKEGVDYNVLSGDAQVQRDGRVEVNEFFWFGCPSCFRFEPALLNWLANDKPDSINFVPIPAILTDGWEFHARVHYAFEILGLHEELSEKFYNELHVNRKRIMKPKALAEWAQEQENVDIELLLSSLSSFATNTKLNQARLLASKYRINGVPSLVVGGKYHTSPAMAGSGERALKIVEYLANKILTEQGGTS